MNSKPNRIRLQSPLLPAECLARLAVAIDHESDWFSIRLQSAVPKPVIGRITGSTLRLRMRIGYRNSFQTSLFAEIRPEGTGAVVAGRYGMFPATSAFMAVWAGFLVLIGGAVFVAAATAHFQSSDPRQSDNNPGLMIVPGMLVFAAVLVGLGRLLARDEAGFITGFLVQLLEIEVPPPLPDRTPP